MYRIDVQRRIIGSGSTGISGFAEKHSGRSAKASTSKRTSDATQSASKCSGQIFEKFKFGNMSNINFLFIDLLNHAQNSIVLFSRCIGGKRWDVRLDYVRQFKTDYVRQLEGLVFEKKKFIYQLG